MRACQGRGTVVWSPGQERGEKIQTPKTSFWSLGPFTEPWAGMVKYSDRTHTQTHCTISPGRFVWVGLGQRSRLQYEGPNWDLLSYQVVTFLTGSQIGCFYWICERLWTHLWTCKSNCSTHDKMYHGDPLEQGSATFSAWRAIFLFSG